MATAAFIKNKDQISAITQRRKAGVSVVLEEWFRLARFYKTDLFRVTFFVALKCQVKRLVWHNILFFQSRGFLPLWTVKMFEVDFHWDSTEKRLVTPSIIRTTQQLFLSTTSRITGQYPSSVDSPPLFNYLTLSFNTQTHFSTTIIETFFHAQIIIEDWYLVCVKKQKKK